MKLAAFAFIFAVYSAFRWNQTEGFIALGFAGVTVVSAACGILLIAESVQTSKRNFKSYYPHDMP